MSEINFSIKEKLESLRNSLLDKDPIMPTLLAEIHKLLRQYPENVSLLSDEEIQVISKGLKTHQNIELAPKAKGKAAPKSTSKLDAKSALAKLKASMASTKVENGRTDFDL